MATTSPNPKSIALAQALVAGTSYCTCHRTSHRTSHITTHMSTFSTMFVKASISLWDRDLRHKCGYTVLESGGKRAAARHPAGDHGLSMGANPRITRTLGGRYSDRGRSMATSSASNVLGPLCAAALRHEAVGLTDAELLGRFVRRRDEVALALLVRRHGPMVW